MTEVTLIEGGQRQERALLYCATGSPSESWAGKRDEAEPGCVGASCELWCYPQQPTGAGIPGAREVGTEYRNSRRQPPLLQEENGGG